MWSRSKSPDTPAEMDDFQLLPDNQGWHLTIHLKDEGYECSISKKLIQTMNVHIQIASEFYMSHIRMVTTPDLWNQSQNKIRSKIYKAQENRLGLAENLYLRLAVYVLLLETCKIVTFRDCNETFDFFRMALLKNFLPNSKCFCLLCNGVT